MDTSFEKKKEKLSYYKKKNPLYEKILDFYNAIITEQQNINKSLKIVPPEINKELKSLHMKEGFPLLDKEHFVIDFLSSVNLFKSLCRIGKDANEKMNENIHVIEKAISDGILKIEDLLKRHYDESFVDEIAEYINTDKIILKFLIHMSIMPSIHKNVENLNKEVDEKNWLKGYCPICGSLPQISELRGEGQRYFLCSFCGFEWRGERLKCSFCGNDDHKKLHYFYAEGQETYRVDLCDSCKQYIKTVDSRKLNYEPYLILEDITTIHLDIIASEQDYKRPSNKLWRI